jgi:hypothetical protein
MRAVLIAAPSRSRTPLQTKPSGWGRAHFFRETASDRPAAQSKNGIFRNALSVRKFPRVAAHCAHEKNGAILAQIKLVSTPMANVLDQPRLGRHGGDRRSEKARADQGSDKSDVPTLIGRGRDYDLARLDRDRPDLAARVRAKELSANAAAVEAGFRKPALKGWARSRRIDPAALIG